MYSQVAFKDNLYVIGGFDEHNKGLNDVWRTADGINWMDITSYGSVSNRVWCGRSNHQVVVHGDQLFVIGGYDEDGGVLNDVWMSSNGLKWEEVTQEAKGPR